MSVRFERMFGAYPISIATSLALEGISHTGEYLDRGNNAPIVDMECIMINLRTLIRNAVGAFPTQEQQILTNKTVYDSCYEDFMYFTEQVKQFNPYCKVELYASTYNTLNTYFKEVNFKKFDTVKQITFEVLERGIVGMFRDKNKEQIKIFDFSLSGAQRSVLLTHHPIDLLSYYNFPDLVLLESHTGVLKQRKDWGSKLNTPKGCNTIPFNKPMLCIFGDKVFINGQAPKIKKVLLAISEKYAWNGLTTVSKQIADCKRGNEIHLAKFIEQYK